MLQSLKSVRVWRFDLYYFLVFGCFVSFAGWLVTYYTNLYALDLATVGFLASCFSLPSGIIRAFGGWLSDKFGARKLMYWVLGSSLIFSSMLIISKMDIFPSGRGVMAKASGTITDVSTSFVELDSKKYSILNKTDKLKDVDNEFHVFPVKESWQQVVVKKGDIVKKKQLIAEGKTHIFFQANLSIFAIISIIIGSIWGIRIRCKIIFKTYKKEVTKTTSFFLYRIIFEDLLIRIYYNNKLLEITSDIFYIYDLTYIPLKSFKYSK